MSKTLKKCEGVDVGGFRVGNAFYDMRLFMNHRDQMLLFKMGKEDALLEVSSDSFLTIYREGRTSLQIGKFFLYGEECFWGFKFFDSGEKFEFGVRDIFKAEEQICKLLVERGVV